MLQLCRQVYQAGNNCFQMARFSLSGLSSKVILHLHEVEGASVLSICKGVGDVQWAAALHLGLARTRAAKWRLSPAHGWAAEENLSPAPTLCTPFYQAPLQSSFKWPSPRF